MIKYRFSINGVYVSPVWPKDLAKDYTLESEQVFFRKSLSSALVFLRSDFDWLYAQSLETEFILLIEKSNDSGATWEDYHSGKFAKTDCEWDIDGKRVEVSVQIKDQYENVLAYGDDTVDVIKSGVRKNTYKLSRKGVLQVYALGGSSLENILEGSRYTQEVDTAITSDSELTDTYHFGLAATLCKATASGFNDMCESEDLTQYLTTESSITLDSGVIPLEPYKINFDLPNAYAVDGSQKGRIRFKSVNGGNDGLIHFVKVNESGSQFEAVEWFYDPVDACYYSKYFDVIIEYYILNQLVGPYSASNVYLLVDQDSYTDDVITLDTAIVQTENTDDFVVRTNSATDPFDNLQSKDIDSGAIETYTIKREATSFTIPEYTTQFGIIGNVYRDSNNNLWGAVYTSLNVNGDAFVPLGHTSAMPTSGTLYVVVVNKEYIASTSPFTSEITYTSTAVHTGKYANFVYRDSDDKLMYYSGYAGEGLYSAILNNITNDAEATDLDYDSKTDRFFGVQGSVGDFTITYQAIAMYTRYLTSLSTYDSTATIARPTDDIIASDYDNYGYIYEWAEDYFHIANFGSETGSDYGSIQGSDYYMVPPTLSGVPVDIIKEFWTASSIWIDYQSGIFSVLESGLADEKTLFEGIKIENFIKTILAEIDSDITHQATSEYSQFLYGTVNPISDTPFRLMLTQKSNILNIDYDYAATTGETSFNNLMAMLRDTFRLFWYITDDNKLIIEHEDFFKNGGQYGATKYVDTITSVTIVEGSVIASTGLYLVQTEYGRYNLDLTTYTNPSKIYFQAPVGDDSVGYAFYDESGTYISGDYIDSADSSNSFEWVEEVIPSNAATFRCTIIKDAYADDETIGYTFEYINVTYAIPNEIQSNIDLTNLVNTRSGKTWAFGMNKYSYNKEDIPEKYTFEWMDEVGTGFKGKDIVVNSKFVTKGNTEDISISDYCPDIPSMLFAPDDFSQDGFAIMAVDAEGVSIPVVVNPSVSIGGISVYLQNGYLSWFFLHPNFWTYDLPSTNVDINGELYTGTVYLKKIRKQEVQYASLDDPNPLYVVKTGLGEGQIEKISVNLSSRMNNITLKYEPE